MKNQDMNNNGYMYDFKKLQIIYTFQNMLVRYTLNFKVVDHFCGYACRNIEI